ncbi:methionine ABC transporter permease [Propioniferax innocua]|uniref:D-methionine transport system permease protein n=1 Tax=Propioniferax innocua TaxID=1753 RepID=A0A542Z8D0_9ACTN|nr:methionine ABC transporter permease [Propioniferax innocua]TQL56551.1 D-methionine transport system permease protein [Propioniferax innocua]
MNWSRLAEQVLEGTIDTFYMCGLTLVFTVLIGLPMGVLLVVLDRGGVLDRLGGSRLLSRVTHRALSIIVDIGRSLPFIILMVALIPVTRFIAGTSIGATAAVVPLSAAGIPFFARLVEIAIREVPGGLVEAVESMGGGPWSVIRTVLVPEALPAMILGLSTTVVSLINFSAMAGAIGAGGLGDVAVRFGYQRFEPMYVVVVVIELVLITGLVQSAGSWAARRMSKR